MFYPMNHYIKNNSEHILKILMFGTVGIILSRKYDRYATTEKVYQTSLTRRISFSFLYNVKILKYKYQKQIYKIQFDDG